MYRRVYPQSTLAKLKEKGVFLLRTDLSVQNNTAFCGSFYDNFFKRLPNREIKNSAQYNKLGHALASPHWNRLVLGGAAIATQPAIDFFNPKVDIDTAATSALRTMAKIIVCTAVGFLVRGTCFALANKFIHANPKMGYTGLTPEAILKQKNPKAQESMLKLHRNTVSTVSALGVMMFTNFLLDAPFATMLANKFISKYYASKEKTRGAA